MQQNERQNAALTGQKEKPITPSIAATYQSPSKTTINAEIGRKP